MPAGAQPPFREVIFPAFMAALYVIAYVCQVIPGCERKVSPEVRCLEMLSFPLDPDADSELGSDVWMGAKS